MCERVQIAARIRPLIDTDPADSEVCVAKTDDRHVVVGGTRSFTVDRVYDMDAPTRAMFGDLVEPLIDDFLSGFNSTVIAYGQTGTGKTHTIQELIPLVVDRVVRGGLHGCADELQFQYLEVYGESLRDLFSRDVATSAKELQLFDKWPTRVDPASEVVGRNAREGCYVAGVVREKRSSIGEILEVIHRGSLARATGATGMNAGSSRSHSILTIFYEKYQCKLNLVDLAGSERNKKTHNTGQRFQESVGINTGLLALGNVIRALARNAQQQRAGPGGFFPSLGHVPYRSSKLTRLLQDALGGNSKTVFIACVAPDRFNSDESVRSLQYCCLASKILNEPTREYRDMCERRDEERRRELLKRLNHRMSAAAAPPPAPDEGDGIDAPVDDDDELLFLRQYCKEQDEEIAATNVYTRKLEQHIASCEEELRLDDVVFARQIHDMQALSRENASLRTKVAQLEKRFAFSSIPHVDAPSAIRETSAGSGEGGVFFDMRDVSVSSDSEAGDGERYADSSFDYYSPSTVHQDKPRPPQPPLRDKSNNQSPPKKGAAAADEPTHLARMTQKALEFQNENSALRQELSSVMTAYKNEQRQTALLRIELDNIYKLFDEKQK